MYFTVAKSVATTGRGAQYMCEQGENSRETRDVILQNSLSVPSDLWLLRTILGFEILHQTIPSGLSLAVSISFFY